MTSDIILSIVVPVYNVEKYLRECIDSIISGMGEDCELLLIDDGSPDNSGAICDEYADAYSNIDVIHQENKGLAGARNTGIRAASGKYITFIDSDDRVAAGSVARILQQLRSREEFDLCFLKCDKFYPDGKVLPMVKPIPGEALRGKSRLEVLNFIISLGKYPASAWGKVFRRDFLKEKGIYFHEEYRSCEDIDFTYRCFAYGEKFDSIEGPYYEYRQDVEDSMSTRYGFRLFNAMAVAVRSCTKISEDRWPSQGRAEAAGGNESREEPGGTEPGADREPSGAQNRAELGTDLGESHVQELDNLAGGTEPKEEHDCCLAILAYQYIMLLWLATYVEKERKAEADEILKELRWLLDYGRGRKYPVIRTLMSVIGAENTGRLLNFYRLHK